MDTLKRYLIALIVASLSATALTGCSSSELNEEGELTADELPVVDANTDELPDHLGDGSESFMADAPSADGLIPEASVDVPFSSDTSFADTSTTPTTDFGHSSPSFDAPPSMNETASAPMESFSEPVAESAPAPSYASAGNEVYQVQSGDTLMKIAFKVYGDVYQWRKVLDDNSDRISDPAHLVRGTQLRVDHAANESYYDGFERYLIKYGDTLGTISSDIYGTARKWRDLWKMNDGLVKDPNRIYAGFFLRYTAGEGEAPVEQQPFASSNDFVEDPVRNPSSFEEAKVPGSPSDQL
jgi:LysM repeat protein